MSIRHVAVWGLLLCVFSLSGCLEDQRDNDADPVVNADGGGASDATQGDVGDDAAPSDGSAGDAIFSDADEDAGGPTIVELPPGCVEDKDCAGLVDAQNPCREATCGVESGLCAAADLPDGTECGASTACTNGLPSCQGGVCVTKTIVCDDGDVCTDDSCSPLNGCEHKPNTVACDDGDLCTKASKCTVGDCVATAPVKCDDGNACTDDSCDPALGCVFVANSADCDPDGDSLCLIAGCADGFCKQTLKICEGGDNPCALVGCNAKTGSCVVPTGLALNDFKGFVCDDDDPCTGPDTCDGNGGCAGEPLACDDGNLCTTDACEAATGACLHEDNADPCDDGDVCTADDTCSAGACESGAAVSCDDGNLCTVDGCSASTGCVSAPLPGPCNDGDACTTNDACDGGMCAGPDAVDCDDDEVCTSDTCASASGCDHTPLADGTACTVQSASGTCAAGLCVPL